MLQPARKVNPPILAAKNWRTNAELIADIAAVGYLKPTDKVLDPTYGRGIWWKCWRPKDLHAHDLALTGVDFRNLPYADGTFDAVAYDPPYISPGGRKTSTLGGKAVNPALEGSDYHDRYGLVDVPTSPAELQELMNEGLSECARVTKAKGFVLVKCQDYVSSGKLWNGTYYTQRHAIEKLGLAQVDRFERISAPRPQPPHARQVHARRNVSTLLIFQV